MIRSRNPRIDAADLERRIDEELAREPGAGGDDRLARLAALVHARTIEAQLVRAEERSATRTEWPADVRVPGFVSPAIRRLILRVLGLAFRDQHQVNAALIQSQREALALVHTLLDRVDELEARIEAERSAARTARIAQRTGEDA